MREDSSEYNKLASDHRKLEAPASMEKLHLAYLEFLEGQARITAGQADALKEKDLDKMKTLNGEFMTFLTKQMEAVLAEIDKLDASKDTFKADVKRTLKEGK